MFVCAYVCVCVLTLTSVCVTAYFFFHICPPFRGPATLFSKDGENQAQRRTIDNRAAYPSLLPFLGRLPRQPLTGTP